MSKEMECPGCGHSTLRLIVEDGLVFAECEECDETHPAEVWGPTETPPEQYQ